MKKIIFLFSLISSIHLTAQITITTADMPVVGDTLRYSISAIDSTLFADYERSGANLTWNFDSLLPLRQGVRRFVNSSQTPYNSVPPRTANLLADTLRIEGFELYDVYNFYNNDSTSFSLDYRGATAPTGFANIPISQSYVDKDEVLQFPLNYLDRDSSTFKFEFDNAFPPAYYASEGYRINNVDAWGTISTPFGTFSCLRVVTDIITYDTVSFSGNNVGVNSHTREYSWVSNQIGMPLLHLSGNVIDSVFVPLRVEYRDSVREELIKFLPVARFSSETEIIDLGQNVHITNDSRSVLTATYQWNISPSTFTYTGGTSSTSRDEIVFTPADTGFYTVQLIAINADGRDTLTETNFITVNGPTSIKNLDNEFSSKIELYPNPSKAGQQVNLKFSEAISVDKIELLDLKGATLNSIQVNKQLKDFELNLPLTDGIYFVKIYSNQTIGVKRIVVE